MKKVMIIGGHGFLGKNLNEILKADYDCNNFSRVNGFDLTELESALEIVKKNKPEVIINLAARTGSLPFVMNNPATIVSNNMRMYLNLYHIIHAACPDAFVLNVLANCSYPGALNIQNEEEWWNGPVHDSVISFGNAKRFLWVLAECYKKQFGIKSLSCILPNAYGTHDHVDIDKVHAMNGLIIRMIKAKQNLDPAFTIWGTGTPIREWIFMKDAARLIKLCLETNIDESCINFGQQHGISIFESATLIKTALNYEGKLELDVSKPDGAPIKVLSNKRLRKYFPEFQFTSYEEGIKSTIDYYEKML